MVRNFRVPDGTKEDSVLVAEKVEEVIGDVSACGFELVAQPVEMLEIESK